MALWRPTASLPINLQVESDNLSISYSKENGVQFFYSPSEARTQLKAIFYSAMYWVDENSYAEIDSFLPNVKSLVFKNFIVFPTREICYPFPTYFTYENVDQVSVKLASESIIKNSNPEYSDQKIQELLDDFFTNNGPIYCTPGVNVGKAGELSSDSEGNTSNSGRGFWIRTWGSNGKELIYPHVYLHHLRSDPTIPIPNIVYSKLPYGISDSVGNNATNNPNDVYLVKQRLKDIGFSHRVMPERNQWTNSNFDTSGDWIGGNSPDNTIEMSVDTNNDALLEDIIRLFQSIISSRRTVARGNANGLNGRIDSNSETEKFLWARNTPNWVRLETDIANGFESFDDITANFPHLNFDYGTAYLKKAIKKAGQHYINNHWNNLNQQQQNNDAVIRTNDASYIGGGVDT